MYAQFIAEAGGSRPSFERPLDLVHLARQTLGDRDLEREILDLFVTQTKTVLAQLQVAVEPQRRADLAHTLKGSARAVGAFIVAMRAEHCEDAANGLPQAWLSTIDALTASVREVCMSIAEVQQGG